MPSRNTIEIVIEGEDRASGVLNKVNSQLQTIGKVAAGAVAAGIATAGVAVAGFAAAGVREFTNFETKMNEVFTLLPNISQEAMGHLEEDVKRISAQFGTLPDEVIPAVYQAVSAGVPSENVFTFMQVASKAAAGGVTELETAVDGLTSVVNAYGDEVIDAQRASDLMFTAVRLGKTDFTQLSQSLFNVVPTAASLGIEFDNVAAALASLTAQGTPTSVATTQLRQLFVELQKPTTEVSKLFQEISGKSFPDFIKAGGSVDEAFNMIREAAEANGTELASVFGSVEALNAFLGLTGTNAEGFTSNLDEMANSAGATNKAFEQMSKGLQFQLDRLRSKFSILLIEIGSKIVPFITPIVEGFGDVVSVITDFLSLGSGQFDPLAYGGISDFSTKLAGIIEPFHGAFLSAKEAISEFLGAIGAGVPLADAFRELMRELLPEETVTAIENVVMGIKGFAQTVQEILEPITSWISENIKLEDVLIVIGGLIAAVVIPALISLGAALATPIAIIGGLVTAVSLLRQAWEDDFLGIRTFVTEKVWPKIQEFANWFEESGGLIGVFNKAKVAAQQLAALGLGVLLVASNAAKTGLQLLAFFITDTLNKASISATLLIASFGIAISLVGIEIGKIIGKIKEWVETNAGLLLGGSALVLMMIQMGVHTKIATAAIAVAQTVWGVFTGIVSGLTGAMSASSIAATGLVAKMAAVALPIAAVGLAIAGVIAQLREFNRIVEEQSTAAGQRLAQGAPGAFQTQQEFEDALFRQAQEQHGDLGARLLFGSGTFQNMINNAFEEYKKVGTSAVDGYVEGVESNLDKANLAIENLATSPRELFEEKLGIKSPSTVFKEFGLNIVTGLVNGISENVQTVSNELTKITDIFKSFIESVITSFTNLTPRITSEVNKIVQQLSTLTSAINNANSVSSNFSSSRFVSNSGMGIFGFQNGIDFIPRDKVVKVHRGEAILTAQENEQRMSQNNSTSNTFQININAPMTQEQANETANNFVSGLRLAGVEV